MFFDKLCTIYSISYQTVWWFPKRVYTKLYNKIPCNFEKPRERFWMSSKDYAENVDLPKYTIVLSTTYNQVRENQEIVLTDPTLWDVGRYLISRVDANLSMSWSIDCITLFAEEMKWAQQSS